jgi:hydrogenase nickel incorporation protein HypA/HybF
MHETSIALAVVDQIARRAEQDGRRGVRAVTLRVGELAGVVPQALEFCFAQACADTVAQGAVLGIDTVPALARCGGCGRDWPVGMPPDLTCPGCGEAAAHLISGRELEIVAVEWAEPAVRATKPEERDPCAV